MFFQHVSVGPLPELLLAIPDCLSTGLVRLKDCAFGADPLDAASVCQNKLAWGLRPCLLW
jgi:hypothetical protein